MNRPATDRVTAERMMELLRRGADSRQTKIVEIREVVRTAGYETEGRLGVAIENLLPELGVGVVVDPV